ncbi:replication-relaxation family protein [Streptomyces sp. NPDC045251]|uniref:replication-relaxation family protein n=1 Tax=unclassified Streptomyces TaxID=2593676 RepID=UPI0033D8D8C2
MTTTDPQARAAAPASTSPAEPAPDAEYGQEHTHGHAQEPSRGPAAVHTAPARLGTVSPVRKVGERAAQGADSSLAPATTELGVEHELRILQLLACTRVATPHQLHTWLTPTASDTSTVRRHLRRMTRSGLVAANEERRPNIWFLTPAGLAEARRAGLADHRTTSVTGEHVAASPAYAHALAVTATAVAFSRNLRPDTRLGTAFGEVADWEVEVAHPLGSAGLLIPDAVLHLRYAEVPHAFVEVDRATMSLGRLVTKVAAYERYRTRAASPRTPASAAGLPDWWTRYPRAAGRDRFPPLLIVLDGKSADVLSARAADVLNGVATLRGIRNRQFAVGVAALADVQEHGALSAVWRVPVGTDEPVRLAHLVEHTRPHG